MSGHVFVVKGDVRKIRCDARLVPTYDLDRPSLLRWFRQDIGEEKLARPNPASSTERSEGVRLLGALDKGPALWAVKVGHDSATTLADVMVRVARFLERAWEALTPSGGQVDLSRLPSGRSKPLFAMPVVGTGERNFDRVSGAAIGLLLESVTKAVTERDFDVVIVAWEEEKYSALQLHRSSSKENTPVLPKHLDEVAMRLAERAAAGELSVLLGAGLSMNAGLPSWRGLLDAVAAKLRLRASESTESLLAFAQCLEQYVGPRRFRDEIKAVCTAPRHALGHALLASSPVRAFVTLNYDTLLEDAANHKQGSADRSRGPSIPGADTVTSERRRSGALGAVESASSWSCPSPLPSTGRV
jgi:hypothetical protein